MTLLCVLGGGVGDAKPTALAAQPSQLSCGRGCGRNWALTASINAASRATWTAASGSPVLGTSPIMTSLVQNL